MSSSWLVRTEMMFGAEALEKLSKSCVAVFGVGGVGGYVVEALARSGVGKLVVIDDDVFAESNLNRQLHATRSALGRNKVDVVKERVADINPDCRVQAVKAFFLPENSDEFDFASYDYVVDAIDTVAGKLRLAELSQEMGFPLISAMGAGNKCDPTSFRIADVYETSVCPLAKVMRRELKKRGVKKLKVVYSQEEPRKPLFQVQDGNRRAVPASNAFTPSVVGLIVASEVVKDLVGQN